MKVGPWSGRQDRKSGKVKVLSPSIARSGRIAYPVCAEVTKHAQPGCKKPRLPCEICSGGSDLGGKQTRRREHNGMSANLEISPRKIAFAEQAGKPS